MPLAGTVQDGQDNALGLDFNADGQHMTPKLAQAFIEGGYSFCVRYVPREATAKTVDFDMRAEEASFLMEAGFAIMAVQHFKTDAGWVPSSDLGKRYGEFAASWSRNRIGLPDGVCVFCDLEAVASAVPTSEIIGFCLEWHAQVENAGYSPGLYLGDRARLTGQVIASQLPFKHYWLAFTEVFDIPGRGFQMKQLAVGASSKLRPAAASGFQFQADRIQRDQKGETVRWLRSVQD